MKCYVIVIDGFGVGELPDADKYGDVGSNTLLNIANQERLHLPNLTKLGLLNIDGINLSQNDTLGNYGRLQETSPAKDTTAGHYEMMNILMKQPYPTFPKGFPSDLIDLLTEKCGIQFIGNVVANGVEIINRLGQESIDKKAVIIYTSADSVLQIACHDSVMSYTELHNICAKIRKLCTGKYNIGRVIARPFEGKEGNFSRTIYRKDFALKPPADSIMVEMQRAGFMVYGIGKINDIFEGVGITQSNPTKTNTDGLNAILEVGEMDFSGLVFANLVDTDMLYGHRNNVSGYARALEQIDKYIPLILAKLKPDDVLIITGDHGCDPTTPSNDHSREYTPLVVYGHNLTSNHNFHTLNCFNHIGLSILDYFGIRKTKDSIIIKRSN